MVVTIRQIAVVGLVGGALLAAGCGKSGAWQNGHDVGYDMERQGYDKQYSIQQCPVQANVRGYDVFEDSWDEFVEGCKQGWEDRHYST